MNLAQYIQKNKIKSREIWFFLTNVDYDAIKLFIKKRRDIVAIDEFQKYLKNHSGLVAHIDEDYLKYIDQSIFNNKKTIEKILSIKKGIHGLESSKEWTNKFLERIPERIYSNINFLKSLHSFFVYPQVLQIWPSLSGNRNVVKLVSDHNGNQFKFASSDIKKDKDFILTINPEERAYICHGFSDELLKDPIFIEKLFVRNDLTGVRLREWQKHLAYALSGMVNHQYESYKIIRKHL